MLFNLHSGTWDEELLTALGVPLQMLPEVRSSSEIYGQTAAGVFETPVPIGGIAGDQQSALFGQNCFTRGMAKNTYGTGCFMLMNIGPTPVPSRHELITTVAWKAGGKTEYALEGSVFIGGAVVQWLRDGLGIIKSSAEVEALAASVPDCGGVYLVPAFAGLGDSGPERNKQFYEHRYSKPAQAEQTGRRGLRLLRLFGCGRTRRPYRAPARS